VDNANGLFRIRNKYNVVLFFVLVLSGVPVLSAMYYYVLEMFERRRFLRCNYAQGCR